MLSAGTYCWQWDCTGSSSHPQLTPTLSCTTWREALPHFSPSSSSAVIRSAGATTQDFWQQSKHWTCPCILHYRTTQTWRDRPCYIPSRCACYEWVPSTDPCCLAQPTAPATHVPSSVPFDQFCVYSSWWWGGRDQAWRHHRSRHWECLIISCLCCP